MRAFTCSPQVVSGIRMSDTSVCRYIIEYRSWLMRAIRLEEGRRVCGAVSQSRTSGGRRPPLSLSTLSLSLIIIIIHDRRRPAVSPRLAKSIDMFSVAFKPGHVDHGTLSVHDAFASDFESFFCLQLASSILSSIAQMWHFALMFQPKLLRHRR